MIDAIGFKNFRRFENFPTMKLGKINVFVGRNNAGKSTVIKAIELFKGNLKNLSSFGDSSNVFAQMRPMFVFDVEETSEIHIGNFDRALYNKAERKEITLSADYNDCHVEIVLDGENVKKEQSRVSIPYSSILLKLDNGHFKMDYKTRHLTAIFNKRETKNVRVAATLKAKLKERQDKRDEIKNRIRELQKFSHENTGDMTEVAFYNIERQQHEAVLKILDKEIKDITQKIELEYDNDTLELDIENLPEFADEVRVNIFAEIIRDIVWYAELDPCDDVDGRTKDAKKAEEQKKKIRQNKPYLLRIAREIRDNMTKFNTYYIPAHAATQKVVFLKSERNDLLSATLNEYAKLHITLDSREHKFVRKWMGEKGFGIGADFVVSDFMGEGYTIDIIDKGDKMPLADKGVGSIQIMTLLLNLAVIMRKADWCPTVLIEEPEQNIHPCLQSVLADMLEDYQKTFSTGDNQVQLIVETHSEYLIRRIQGIVADKDYVDDKDMKDDNPFRVFYFDSANEYTPWYEMEFLTTGNFKNCFGPGFFDTASNLDNIIIQKEYQKIKSVSGLDELASILK